MPAADGADASNGGSELELMESGQRMVPATYRDRRAELMRHLQLGPSQPERLVGSSQFQQPVAVNPEVREQLLRASGPEVHEEQQPPETQQQDGAGASDGGSALGLVAEVGVETVPVRDGDGDERTEFMRPPAGSSQSQLPVAIIPKVREQLRRVAGDQFTPRTVLIGPYHRRKDYYSYPWMDEKKKAVHDLEGMVGNLSVLKWKLDELSPQVRECYTHLPENHYMDRGEAFTDMLLHDGCYLLTFFIKFIPLQTGTTPNDRQGGGGGGSEDQILANKDNTLVRDILYLVENQIPMFVLEQMLEQVRAEGTQINGIECIARRVEHLLQKQLYISKTMRPVPLPSSSSTDLLRLVYSYFRHPMQDDPPGEGGEGQHGEEQVRSLTGRWRRATDYSRYADLRFRRREFRPDHEWTILDIHLEGGTLYIPFLRIDSNTWTMLRNLMALEEREETRPVTAYCIFMSQVACTEEDVDLLQRNNILEHFLGSNEQAAKGFGKLCEGVALDIDNLQRNYLKPMWHHLNMRCRKQVYNFKGFFRHKYCTNVFYRLAFSIALLLFVCQVTQSIYAVVAYHKPPK